MMNADMIIEAESLEFRIHQSDHQKRVERFMRAAGQVVPDAPCIPMNSVCELRARLVLEEALETIDGLGYEIIPNGDADHVHMGGLTLRRVKDPDIVKVVDGCADTSVVSIGTLSAFGVKDEHVLREVDRSNTAKTEGGVVRDQSGKVQKPKGWSPPNITRVLMEQGWEA